MDNNPDPFAAGCFYWYHGALLCAENWYFVALLVVLLAVGYLVGVGLYKGLDSILVRLERG